jgi:hypothetical protein
MKSKRTKRAKLSRRSKTAVQDSDVNKQPEFAARVERALLRAGESARRTARMYGTPLYALEKGRIVAKRP